MVVSSAADNEAVKGYRESQEWAGRWAEGGGQASLLRWYLSRKLKEVREKSTWTSGGQSVPAEGSIPVETQRQEEGAWQAPGTPRDLRRRCRASNGERAGDEGNQKCPWRRWGVPGGFWSKGMICYDFFFIKSLWLFLWRKVMGARRGAGPQIRRLLQ